MASEKQLDLIDRSCLLLKTKKYEFWNGELYKWHCVDVEDITNAPTVDAVEVVRCKDCIHRVYVDMGDDIGEIGGCELFGCAMPYDAFCSYGERKNNG